MSRFCPDLKGIDTSNTKEFSEDIIKPDVTYYHSSRSDEEKPDIKSAELIVEAELDIQDDPFNDTPDDKGLLCDSDGTRQTLGQMMRYATAHLAAQFRIHVFSILPFPKPARLLRWDRAGVIVSDCVSLDKSQFAEFFWRFNNADAKDRGHDPTVTPFKFTKDLTKQFIFKQLQFEADPGDVKLQDVKFFEVMLPRENRRYVIGKATYLGVASLASRATRSFRAWCLETKKPVFPKGTWRILSDSQRPERDIHERLGAAKVPYIATVLDHSDVKNHLTIIGKYPFRTLQRYRLVLREIGRSLTSFTDFREVLAAMRDALQGNDTQLTTILLLTDLAAHRESYYQGRVLHRDISPENIIIHDGGGLLIDWDMSKDSDETSISRPVCVYFSNLRFSSSSPVAHFQGTWAFQSLRLSQRPENDDPPVVQNRLDDLESFYHVLFWISLQHARHELHPVELYDQLTWLFHHALIVDDMPYSNSRKDSHMTSTIIITRAKFQNRPLFKLLLDISVNLRPLYVTPSASGEKLTKPQIKKAQWVEESYEQALEIHKEDLDFLNSQEFSNWMELRFIQALKCSDDEWGSTEYILNKKAERT